MHEPAEGDVRQLRARRPLPSRLPLPAGCRPPTGSGRKAGGRPNIQEQVGAAPGVEMPGAQQRGGFRQVEQTAGGGRLGQVGKPFDFHSVGRQYNLLRRKDAIAGFQRLLKRACDDGPGAFCRSQRRGRRDTTAGRRRPKAGRAFPAPPAAPRAQPQRGGLQRPDVEQIGLRLPRAPHGGEEEPAARGGGQVLYPEFLRRP